MILVAGKLNGDGPSADQQTEILSAEVYQREVTSSILL
jgi:hypothetical protein